MCARRIRRYHLHPGKAFMPLIRTPDPYKIAPSFNGDLQRELLNFNYGLSGYLSRQENLFRVML